MTEEEFVEHLSREMISYDCEGCAKEVYALVLRHLLEDVLVPTDSAKGLIYAVQRRLDALEDT